MLLFSPLVVKNFIPEPLIPLPTEPDLAAALKFRTEVDLKFALTVVPPGVSPSRALRDSLLALTSQDMQSGKNFAHGLADIIEWYVKANLTAFAANMDINAAIYSTHIHPVAGVLPAVTAMPPPIPTPPLYA